VIGEVDMIRKAESRDIQEIIEIVLGTIPIMREEGSDQWDDTYPLRKDFERDLQNGSLFVFEHNQEVIGSIAVDQIQPKEYKTITWSRNEPAYVFHRLAVKPGARKLGVASQLIDFAEKYALLNGVKYMRIDTYSVNQKAQQLFLKKGYKKIGVMEFYGKAFPFYCFDKELSVNDRQKPADLQGIERN
jgi:GNAT superfamily N-acetyltransferase